MSYDNIVWNTDFTTPTVEHSDRSFHSHAGVAFQTNTFAPLPRPVESTVPSTGRTIAEEPDEVGHNGVSFNTDCLSSLESSVEESQMYKNHLGSMTASFDDTASEPSQDPTGTASSEPSGSFWSASFWLSMDSRRSADKIRPDFAKQFQGELKD